MTHTQDQTLLQAGVTRTIITPPVGFQISGPEFPDRRSSAVNDDLLARSFVLQVADTKAAIISLDVWAVAPQLADRIRDQVAQATDIPRQAIVITATGNATSPPLWRNIHQDPQYRSYGSYLPYLIAGSALNALNNLEPAAAGATTVNLPNLNCFADGTQPENAEDESQKLALMLIQDARQTPILLAASFPCPATVLGNQTEWSADYPGVTCWAIEQSGAEMGFFTQATSADIRPFDWHTRNPQPSHSDRTMSDAQTLGILLATRAAQAAQNIPTKRNVRIRTASDHEQNTQALQIEDAVFIAIPKNQPVSFTAEIRKRLPDINLFINPYSQAAALEPNQPPDKTLLQSTIDLVRKLDSRTKIA